MENGVSIGHVASEKTGPVGGSTAFGRRLGLKALGVTALAASVGARVEVETAHAATRSGAIRIGYVTPTTGSLANYAVPDSFVLNLVRDSSHFAKGITIGNVKYKIEIIAQDSRSDPSFAQRAAIELIQLHAVDLIVTGSAPEMTLPVIAVCEGAGIPCLSTLCPWETWWGGFPGNSIDSAGNGVGESPEFCAMFFLGITEMVKCFVPMWDTVLVQTGANRVYAEMFPNDADGDALRASWSMMLNAVVIAKDGSPWTSVDGSAYADLSTDYSAMIQTFKSGSGGKSCDFLINSPVSQDFSTFWKQASKQDWRPKLATVTRAMLFPVDVYALGDLSNNVATNCWFAANAPYKSSLTGMTASAFAADYQMATQRQWEQSMGSTYSLFEIVIEALRKVQHPHDRKALANALKEVNYDGICGPLNLSSPTNPARGIGILRPVGVQWKPGSRELVGRKNWPWSPWVVDNTLNQQIPLQASLEPTSA